MVHINGKDMDVAGQSLMAYLEANDYEKGTFVVECNGLQNVHPKRRRHYRNRPVYGRWLRYISDVSLKSTVSVHLQSKFFLGRCSRWYISDVSLKNTAPVHLRSKYITQSN